MYILSKQFCDKFNKLCIKSMNYVIKYIMMDVLN